MAGSEAAKEAIYLSTFLRELGLDMSKPPPLKLDNKSAIDLAYNPEHHSKTKHIERRHYSHTRMRRERQTSRTFRAHQRQRRRLLY